MSQVDKRRATIARPTCVRVRRRLEDVSLGVDPQAAEAVEGLASAALNAERYGLSVRAAKLTPRKGRDGGWFVSIARRQELLACWYPGSQLLLLAGRRLLVKTPTQAVRLALRRLGPMSRVA